MSNIKWIFFTKKIVPSIEANVAAGNTICFRAALRMVTHEGRATVDCEIREISRRRYGHRRLIFASIVALCPFNVPSTPFRWRGNVP